MQGGSFAILASSATLRLCDSALNCIPVAVRHAGMPGTKGGWVVCKDKTSEVIRHLGRRATGRNTKGRDGRALVANGRGTHGAFQAPYGRHTFFGYSATPIVFSLAKPGEGKEGRARCVCSDKPNDPPRQAGGIWRNQTIR